MTEPKIVFIAKGVLVPEKPPTGHFRRTRGEERGSYEEAEADGVTALNKGLWSRFAIAKVYVVGE